MNKQEGRRLAGEQGWELTQPLNAGFPGFHGLRDRDVDHARVIGGWGRKQCWSAYLPWSDRVCLSGNVCVCVCWKGR